MRELIFKCYRWCLYVLKWIPLYHKFGEMHWSSDFKKPLRLVNPKKIFIGQNVNIMHLGRMECIDGGIHPDIHGKIVIGDGTSIEQGAHIVAGDILKIGKDVTISAYVYISDCAHGLADITQDVNKQPLVIKKTEIKDGAFIGIGAKIMPGVTIGKHAVVGANAVVTKDVPDYSMVGGVPAKVLKIYDFEEGDWR